MKTAELMRWLLIIIIILCYSKLSDDLNVNNAIIDNIKTNKHLVGTQVSIY